jgi:hypothetical protein
MPPTKREAIRVASITYYYEHRDYLLMQKTNRRRGPEGDHVRALQRAWKRRRRVRKACCATARDGRVSYANTGFRLTKKPKGAATVAKKMKEGKTHEPRIETASIARIIQVAHRFPDAD